ncbi:MAG TPA: hypothetical protein VJP59_00420 [Gemmatimonadota bacterium]|nr:hypothetical protein [Gemmatimonadota bacterium]
MVPVQVLRPGPFTAGGSELMAKKKAAKKSAKKKSAKKKKK